MWDSELHLDYESYAHTDVNMTLATYLYWFITWFCMPSHQRFLGRLNFTKNIKLCIKITQLNSIATLTLHPITIQTAVSDYVAPFPM